MSKKQKLMTGNQAIARGFYEAGGLLAASYPGSPTVDIMESIQKDYGEEIYGEFSVNEKVALEVGIGGSFAGARSMVSMKHVGVNIAADPLMTFTQTRTNGGFLLVTGEDPEMASSQNEQDNRIFGKFAHMPILDPSDSNEAKEFVKIGLDISEKYGAPVMLRITSRLCHSRSAVELGNREEKDISGFPNGISNFGMIPPNTYRKQYEMKERIEKLAEDACNMSINVLEEGKNDDVLIITSGLVYNNIKELGLDVSIYKLGMVFPLPIEKIRGLSKKYNRIIVIEELMPFIENELKINDIPCEGKKYFSFTGELNTENIEKGLFDAGIIEDFKYKEESQVETVGRLPMFCAGCPHRPVFDILKKSKTKVIGDIGCYSMGVLYPLEVLNSVISMGASIGIMKGMTKALGMKDKREPIVGVIGDGTFYHSGMTGAVNMLHKLDPEDNMTLIILNNGTTAMTGGQHTGSSGNYTPDDDMDIDMVELLNSMGFDRIKVVDQFKYKEAKKTIEDEIKYPGLSIVITTRPCALRFKIKEPHFYVDPEVCIGCRSCVRTNCPPIKMKKYDGIDKLKSSIDSDMCVGCSVCAQVCPVNAIKRSE
ncbi:indolepyruvate ferredoxin oxidoreductase subunit alpha [Clostridiisalibacter paucivorans]|uniref:indolepyruvate ferredoxin oxidoreductase subunit alpha n=1 Tax=Clostridiisalibacter paucivorans TaxID=408753 RepID=UPI0004797325|nr:indolepyruvate ferredoxin oxidoreductase subunit alpha [Clostridiisalibacter paucivorans]